MPSFIILNLKFNRTPEVQLDDPLWRGVALAQAVADGLQREAELLERLDLLQSDHVTSTVESVTGHRVMRGRK
jgi:hypothetical protein